MYTCESVHVDTRVCTRITLLHAQDEVDVKKDTERADEIRAMKRAWEDAEPGRAAKVSVVRVFHEDERIIGEKRNENTS